jgi:hypothetical protein
MINIKKRIQEYVPNPSFILRRGLPGRDGKIGMLVFAASSTPKLYVKIARFRGPNRSIRREKEVLEKIQKESIPKVVFFEEIDGRDVLGLEGKLGFPMLSRILGQGDRRQEQSLRFLEMGFDWLAGFRETGWAHGDFCPKNLLVAGDRLNVVDWEYAFPNARPSFDLFYFCLKFGFWLFGQGREDGRRYAFWKTFLEENWFSSRVKEELREFAGLRDHFFESIEFQARKEYERTGTRDNFWADLLGYARDHREGIL